MKLYTRKYELREAANIVRWETKALEILYFIKLVSQVNTVWNQERDQKVLDEIAC